MPPPTTLAWYGSVVVQWVWSFARLEAPPPGDNDHWHSHWSNLYQRGGGTDPPWGVWDFGGVYRTPPNYTPFFTLLEPATTTSSIRWPSPPPEIRYYLTEPSAVGGHPSVVGKIPPTPMGMYQSSHTFLTNRPTCGMMES